MQVSFTLCTTDLPKYVSAVLSSIPDLLNNKPQISILSNLIEEHNEIELYKLHNFTTFLPFVFLPAQPPSTPLPICVNIFCNPDIIYHYIVQKDGAYTVG